MIFLVTKPFSLVKLFCMFGVRTLFIVVQTLVELLRNAICFHVNIFWGLVMWFVAFVSLPARVLTALQRERLLEFHLHEMHVELENLVWERMELEERLQKTMKERRVMRVMLAELEEEHDEAILKMELLESELQGLKNENFHLKEVQSKTTWGMKGEEELVNVLDIEDDKYVISYDMQSWGSSYKRNDSGLQDLAIQKDSCEENTSKMKMQNFMKESAVGGRVYPYIPGNVSIDLDTSIVFHRQRKVAVSQSLFSAILSLLVGIVIWEAEERCMPLVVALFIVVGMSLRSVVQFFCTIKNKPASDAVVLLSLNWFILGALSYPTLPRIVRLFATVALGILANLVAWLGLSS